MGHRQRPTLTQNSNNRDYLAGECLFRTSHTSYPVITKPDHMWETLKTVHLKEAPRTSICDGPYPLLAQLVEQWTVVPMVTCSNQVERTIPL